MEAIRLSVNSDRGRFVIDKQSLKKEGLHTYQWIVTQPDHSRRILSGVTENLYQRIPTYIREFNQKRPKSELAKLVANLKNKTIVVIRKADEKKGAQEVEKALIKSVKKNENLNRTAGGNGGGSWAQFGKRKAALTKFKPGTPEKYYPFEQRATHIACKTSPTICKQRSAIYKARNKMTGESYIGMSTNVMARIRTHASKASHAADTSLSRAIQANPEQWEVGVLPYTNDLSPLSLREAEKRAIQVKKPTLNANKGGGGPAPMRKPKQPATPDASTPPPRPRSSFCGGSPALTRRTTQPATPDANPPVQPRKLFR
jgi:predicted GIY-YIG superfamily endonuclease